MRLMKRDLETVYLKRKVVIPDGRGNKNITYSDDAIKLEMTVEDAGGQTMASIYGDRLTYMKSCKYIGDQIEENKNEKDGICLFVPQDSKPDYKIVSISPPKTHTNITLEKL